MSAVEYKCRGEVRGVLNKTKCGDYKISNTIYSSAATIKHELMTAVDNAIGEHVVASGMLYYKTEHHLPYRIDVGEIKISPPSKKVPFGFMKDMLPVDLCNAIAEARR